MGFSGTAKQGGALEIYEGADLAAVRKSEAIAGGGADLC